MAAGDLRVAEKVTTGGFKSATFYSGSVTPSVVSAPNAFATGADVMLQSGAGRLDIVIAHTAQASGQAVVFYDAAAPVSGGPIPASGHRVCGILPAPAGLAASGYPDASIPAPGAPIVIGLVFTSGLCFSSKSGQPPFTVNWTSEDLR